MLNRHCYKLKYCFMLLAGCYKYRFPNTNKTLYKNYHDSYNNNCYDYDHDNDLDI